MEYPAIAISKMSGNKVIIKRQQDFDARYHEWPKPVEAKEEPEEEAVTETLPEQEEETTVQETVLEEGGVDELQEFEELKEIGWTSLKGDQRTRYKELKAKYE